MLDLVFRNATSDPHTSYGEGFFESYILKTLGVVGVTERSEVSVTLVEVDRMRELNKQYRSIDKPTDVLSFPLGETLLPGYTIRTLGDIFICPSYAREHAEKEGISLEKKMSWLIVHGTLHLLGYDHERSEKEDTEMSSLEKQILTS